MGNKNPKDIKQRSKDKEKQGSKKKKFPELNTAQAYGFNKNNGAK